MRKSQYIRTYAFLLHDLPMKFSPILPFLTRFRKKKRVAVSPTGFTQKRHTLYAYYSRGKSEFQMIFSHPMPLFIPYYFEKTAAM